MALSGSVATNKYNGVIGLILTWTATQSQVDNQSTIKWTLKSNGSNSASYWVAGNVTVVIDGQTVLRIASSFQLLGGGAWSRSGTVVLDHNEEGEKDFDVSITAGIYAYNSSNTTGSGSFTLNQILRESSIGATDANIGAVSAIAVNRKSGSFTHSIKYAFGSLSGYITAAGGVSSSEVKFSDINIAFTVPTSFYAQIPNAKTGVCTLTITTYYGSTKIGSAKTAKFTVTAAKSDCTPTISGTVVDSNDVTIALTGDSSKLVRYYSKALCTISAAAKNSASIAQKKIGGTTVSGTTRTISAIEADSVAFTATDSRGYSASATVKFDLVPYVKLTNNPTGQRTDPTSGNAALRLKGNYYNGSFGSVTNALTVRYRIAQVGGSYSDYVEVTPMLSGNTYSAEVALSGLNYEFSFNVEVVVTDKLATVSRTITIQQGIPVFDWGKNDFNFNVPVKQNGVKITELCAVYNLLDNSDFRNPVNQRRATAYTYGTTKYTIDRWYTYNGLTVSEGHITLKNTGEYTYNFYQKLPAGKLIPGQKYTLALKLLDGTINCGCIEYEEGAELKAFDAGSDKYALYFRCYGNGDDAFVLSVRAGLSLDVVWCAMYEGEYTTEALPSYRQKGYAAELLACQQYLYIIPNYAAHVGYRSTTSYFFVQLPTQMIDEPTVTASSITLRTAAEFGTSFSTGFAISGVAHDAFGNLVRVSVTYPEEPSNNQPLVATTRDLVISCEPL